VWLVIFLLFIVMESIMQEMIAVSFVGLVSNLIGAVVYKYGVKLEKTNKE
jgi:Co/Zn/Cd efflux system component